MTIKENRNGRQVYDIENGYTVIKEECSWNGRGFTLRFVSNPNSYLPEISESDDNFSNKETGLSFEIQTTSYGCLKPEEIKKVILGYQVAMETIEIVREAFRSN